MAPCFADEDAKPHGDQVPSLYHQETCALGHDQAQRNTQEMVFPIPPPDARVC